MSSDFALALAFLAGVTNRLLELKKRWERALEHPVTRPNLSPEQIERVRQELELSPDQVERLRQRLPIRLAGEQLLHLHDRMRQAARKNQPERSTPPPPGLVAAAPIDVGTYYEEVRRKKWRGIPEEMRGGLRVDRWGVVFEKSPQGSGWRELGSQGDYQILPNSSW